MADMESKGGEAQTVDSSAQARGCLDLDSEARMRQLAIRAKSRSVRLAEFFDGRKGSEAKKKRGLPAARLRGAARRVGTTFALPDALQGGYGSIFLSYARQDYRIAERLVALLRSGGVVVRWDQDLIAGKPFEEQIEVEIKRANAVVVLWSRSAVKSRFVRDEARLALASDKLIATFAPGFDASKLPLGFGSIHAIPVGNSEQLRMALARYAINMTNHP